MSQNGLLWYRNTRTDQTNDSIVELKRSLSAIHTPNGQINKRRLFGKHQLCKYLTNK